MISLQFRATPVVKPEFLKVHLPWRIEDLLASKSRTKKVVFLLYLPSCDCMRNTAWIKHGITATHGHAPLHPTKGRESATKLGIVVNTKGIHAQKRPHETGRFALLSILMRIELRFIMPTIVFSFRLLLFLGPFQRPGIWPFAVRPMYLILR